MQSSHPARILRTCFLSVCISISAMTSPALANADTDYLAANKGKEGVQVTPSGLQYKVLREGKGRQPGANDTVEVHYKGALISGKVFDSSYARGQSISFPLNTVIPGWTEGLQLMNEGAKYELVIPAKLGYGAKGAGNVIPPNATLVFEVELLKVH
jgi:FKBP-type peptidyl-prolyl cis-trans isomerase